MNIVFLDGKTLNPGDLSWDKVHDLGNVQIYESSTTSEGAARARSAHIVVTNKFVLDQQLLAQLHQLKCICVTATGYNNINVAAARAQDIVVCNASGYSTESTAQHTIALLLALTNKCAPYHDKVIQGDWTKSGYWTLMAYPTIELSGKSIGIIGLGNIGRKVAEIAQALGMKTKGYKRSQSSGSIGNIEMTTLDDIFKTCDIISMHAPLNDESFEIINAHSIAMMKPSAFLINTARGGLVNETDLYRALINNQIAGAALDVLSSEPPPLDHPLIGLPNCIITPHIAWATRASRQRLLDITIENIKHFIDGHPQNIVI